MTWFAGTGHLLRIALRRDRVRLPVWILAIAGITYISAQAVPTVYETQEAIDSYAALVGSSPMTVAFAGPPLGLDTIQGIVIYEISFTAIVGVALMALMTTTRHTRAEEESGRAELVRATEVGRHAPAAAALVTTALASTVLGVVLWLSLVASPLSTSSAGVFAAGIALLGIVYAAVGLCLAQVFTHGRTVTGAGLLVFAVGYVLRAAGDVREDWLVWLSPIGWVQASHVPTENRWWPLALPLVTAGLLLLLAVALAERRDFGGGLLPERGGRARASGLLAGTVGLAWRSQWGALVGWSVAMLAMAALTGALGTSMQDMVESNPTLAQYLEVAAGGSILDSYIATMVLILALVIGGFAVWSASHPGADEDTGQVDLMLATPLSRARSMLGNLAVTVLNTTLVLLSAGVGVGVAHGLVTDMGQGWRALVAQMTYLPALLVLVGVVALFRGWRPRWVWVGWIVLTYAFVIGWLGGLLQPPDWLTDLSAFSHVPRVPLESIGGVELVVMVLIAAVLGALGVMGFRRRDIAVAS